MRESISFRGLTITLYDASETSNPIAIWKGTVVGESPDIRNHEIDAIRKLISNLGVTNEEQLILNQNLKQSSVFDSNERSLFESEYFSVAGTQINEMKGLSNGVEYHGYIKTKHVKTKRFNGYVQTFGLKKYNDFTAEEDEVEEWALGLGAYTVFQDGVYTTDYSVGDMRNLDNRNLQKVFSLPLSVGDKSIVRIYEGAQIEFVVAMKDDVVTPAGKFNDCFVIKSTLYNNGKGDNPSFTWLCKKVGIVKKRLATGRIDVLTNIKLYE